MAEGPVIYVIGVEPEGPLPDYPPLSFLWSKCQLLCGGKRHLESVASWIQPETKVVPITTNVPEVLSILKEFVRKGGEGAAVVLATGDPLYHGIGGSLSREIPRSSLVFKPATTLVQRAFALLGEPWEEARVGSLHGKKEEPRLCPGRWIFYTSGGNGPTAVLEMALRQKFRIRTMTVLEEIGLPGQKVTEFDPVDPDRIRSGSFQTLNMVVLTLDE